MRIEIDNLPGLAPGISAAGPAAASAAGPLRKVLPMCSKRGPTAETTRPAPDRGKGEAGEAGKELTGDAEVSDLWESEEVALPLVTAEGADAQVGKARAGFRPWKSRDFNRKVTAIPTNIVEIAGIYGNIYGKMGEIFEHDGF
eukprot:s625_g30.t1